MMLFTRKNLKTFRRKLISTFRLSIARFHYFNSQIKFDSSCKTWVNSFHCCIGTGIFECHSPISEHSRILSDNIVSVQSVVSFLIAQCLIENFFFKHLSMYEPSKAYNVLTDIIQVILIAWLNDFNIGSTFRYCCNVIVVWTTASFQLIRIESSVYIDASVIVAGTNSTFIYC